MKLFYAPSSPFVRKVMVAAHELGITDQLDTIGDAPPNPVDRDTALAAKNPLGKVPTLMLDDGTVLFDSPVICEYLDGLSDQAALYPPAGPARWTALTLQAMGDGLMDAAILIRYEILTREPSERSSRWIDGQYAKIDSSLDEIERHAPTLGAAPDIGTITIACALGYLDFRFADRAWRATHPVAATWFAAFADRPSMQATAPPPS